MYVLGGEGEIDNYSSNAGTPPFFLHSLLYFVALYLSIIFVCIQRYVCDSRADPTGTVELKFSRNNTQ